MFSFTSNIFLPPLFFFIGCLCHIPHTEVACLMLSAETAWKATWRILSQFISHELSLRKKNTPAIEQDNRFCAISPFQSSRAALLWNMDQGTVDSPVTLVIKAPNQKYDDQTINCFLNWTVEKLKKHISNVYPSKPVSLYYYQDYYSTSKICVLSITQEKTVFMRTFITFSFYDLVFSI